MRLEVVLAVIVVAAIAISPVRSLAVDAEFVALVEAWSPWAAANVIALSWAAAAAIFAGALAASLVIVTRAVPR